MSDEVAGSEQKDPAKDAPKRLIALSQFDTKAASEAGITVELDEIPPDDNGVPYSITILGMDAGKVVSKEKKTLDMALRRIRKNQDFGGAEENEQETVDRLAASTIAWHLPPLEIGEPVLECNERNARRVYTDPRFRWIPRKLNKAQGNEAQLFTKRSAS